MNELLEFTTPQDPYFNYCWWPYQPIAATEDKLRPVALLSHSFALAGVLDAGREVVERMRQELGFFRTVYGVKWADGKLSWEYYLYDYKRRQRKVSLSRVFGALSPLIECRLPWNENLPYFMFSFDLWPALFAGDRRLDKVNIYIGNPGSLISSGISYAVTADRTTLENFYFFFDANKQLNQAADKILCSAYVEEGKVDLDTLLRPELRQCHTICVANKREHDTVYFSGINVRQLLFFLRLLNYPPELIGFVEEHQSRLDHLLFDVGFDYTVRNGRLEVVKSGYYGVF